MNNVPLLAKAMLASSFISIASCGGAETPVAADNSVIVDSSVTVTPGYVKMPTKGAMATAGYLSLTAADGDKLLSASSALAGAVEVHTMEMDDGVMKMRPVANLPLPAGETVSLEPGGLHLMIMQPSDVLQTSATIDVTLTFEKAGDVIVTLPLKQPD